MQFRQNYHDEKQHTKALIPSEGSVKIIWESPEAGVFQLHIQSIHFTIFEPHLKFMAYEWS